jgi:hypothetical protein
MASQCYDIAKALSKSDQLYFLIDIVPREDTVCGANRASLSKRVSTPRIDDGLLSCDNVLLV